MGLLLLAFEGIVQGGGLCFGVNDFYGLVDEAVNGLGEDRFQFVKKKLNVSKIFHRECSQDTGRPDAFPALDVFCAFEWHIIQLKRLGHLIHFIQALGENGAGVLLDSVISKKNARLQRLIDQLDETFALLIEEVLLAHCAELHFDGFALRGEDVDFVVVVDVIGGNLFADGLAHFAIQVAQLGFFHVLFATETEHVLFA